MEDRHTNWRGVLWWAKSTLISVFSTLRKFKIMSSNNLKVVKAVKLPLVPVEMKLAKAVAWKKLRRGGVKLNIDGSSLGNPGLAGGGGIFRDKKGRTVAGFASYYGEASNTVAEGRALLDGLQMAQQLGLKDFMVESDSTVMVGWIQSGRWSLWKANMVTDCLAKQGAKNNVGLFTGADVGSGMLRGLLRTDSWELPYLRL
ncbi:uncharacterized protein LOC122316111 [Carya illinoinensis]|uniref:uncharacterized protein LOC122316111 n=1 Tax=Carya illinoinensis TaxID=32201 RepID=UPI001C721610|nr:uncharacterized protein LOC122316111 [Carya illinoinensis]